MSLSGYYVCLGLFAPSLRLFMPWSAHLYYQIFLTVSCIIVLLAVGLVYYWWQGKWNNHPIARELGHLGDADSNWRAVATAINIEFRRIDKFMAGPPTGRRVLVTDSWVMKTSTYFVYVAHQNDIHLSISASEEHNLSYENMTSVQFIHIDVISANPKISNFTLR